MNQTETKSKSKYLVISGYILLVATMTAGLWIIFKNLVDFSDRMVIDESKIELVVVGNVINSLYETEGAYNLSNYDNAKEYLAKYDSIRPVVSSRIDTLKQLSDNPNRILMLDSIEVLLGEKEENLQAIFILMDSVRKAPTIIRQTTNTIVPSRLNNEISEFLKEKNLGPEEEVENVTDTTVIKQERKGLFRRLGDAFAGRQDSTVILQNRPGAIVQKEFELIVDTIVNMVRHSERLNLERQKFFQSALFRRQTAMNHTNLVLTNKIDNLLKTIEKEEIEKNLALIGDRDSTLSKSYQTASVLSIIATAIALLFGLLFVLDFNKVQRYKRQLEESNLRINQLLQSREKLMLTVSHDIKAPMGSILGYIELLESDKDGKEVKNYAQNMKKSGEHVLQLVTGLLDFHKIESGTWARHDINFNLHDLLETTAQSFHPTAQRKKLEYKVNQDIPKQWMTFGEPFMIRLIFSNLISNAIKYTSRGKIEINSSFNKIDNLLKLTVSDTGVGIDRKNQKVIFQEFAQIKSENPDEYVEGSGLGLAITKGLVEQLGGKIGLQSEVGKGSIFTVEIPLQPSKNDIALVTTEETDKQHDFGNTSVLVVDDDTIQLTMVSEMLKRKEINAVLESDSNKATAIIGKKHFDIIFVDIQMPVKNGFALVAEILQSGLIDTGRTALVALSAKSEITLQEFKNAGFNGFLNKPFTSNELYSTIDQYRNTKLADTTVQEKTNRGIASLIEMVKDDRETSVEILHAFIADAQTLRLNLGQLHEDSGSNPSLPRLAHKMLPLFKMMGDESTARTLEQLEKKSNATETEVAVLMQGIESHVREAEEWIAGSDKS